MTRDDAETSGDDGATEERAPQENWGEESMRPWINPPMRKGGSGASQGLWRWAMAVIVPLGIAAIVVLVLVSQDVLASGWAYVALPIGGLCAVTGLVASVFKARIESHHE